MSLDALSLFDAVDVQPYLPPDDCLTVVEGNIDSVQGLSFVVDFVTAGEERCLMWEADREGEWSTHWSRRTKSFGAMYLAVSDQSDRRASIPEWASTVSERLVNCGLLKRLPNQMGINEYMPGQGIASHIDHFGGTVVSLSLGSGCVMEFSSQSDQVARVSLWLPRRSIVVMQGEARNMWCHGIRGRKKDIVNGLPIYRDRRVSLTFRDVEMPFPQTTVHR